MTKSARLRIQDRQLPKILDACCGSGGFLIEALAELSFAIINSTQLTATDRATLKQRLQTESLYGIEANDEIGRIARLNMYLHGDGGSRIYVADSLDKELVVEPGLPNEQRDQLEELRDRLITRNTRFDVVLTNPPFSMAYNKKEADEQRILQSYEIVKGQTAHSNVLFLERYRDLLKADDGEMLTVIDDTVLNGMEAARYRQFIRDNFIIRQIVSLPFNTFFRAQANIKTSILHLRRKRNGERQENIFMAIANNVGHDDSKKDTPHRDNLPEIVNLFIEWDAHGNIPDAFREDDDLDEPLGCPMQVFIVPADQLNWDRLDAFYYAPHYRRLRRQLEQQAETGRIILKRGVDFDLIPGVTKAEKEALQDTPQRYIEITSVTRDGLLVAPMQGLFQDLPTRADLKVRANDVLFAKNNSSRGTAVLVPQWFDGGYATSGFIGVRPQNEEEALILWTIFRSEVWRTQIYYLAITASQPEIRDTIFQQEMLIPWPATAEQRDRIIASARTILEARETERQASEANKQTFQELLLPL